MTVVTETFTGADGSGAPSPWLTATLSGSQNIQSNKWRINDGDSYAGTAMTYGTTVYTNVDISAEITLDSAGAEQYPALAARIQSGGTNGWGSFAEAASYELYLDTNNDNLRLAIADRGFLIDDTHAVAFTFSANTTYTCRLQCIGTT